MVSTDKPAQGPTARLPQGLVVGTTLKGEYPRSIEAFRGIPYALSPTGDRRFRPPVNVPNSHDTIDATQFGPRAPARQFVKVGPALEESEDCLTVNVFRQAQHSHVSDLPVAVYFHGGAFNRGNAAMHDTASMVGWSELPFVGVSFGYRIGALGFLPSKLSATEGALNLGLKDQICLLEWVEENIRHFGGDKNNVTLIGLSAGAHSIGHHLLNYDEGKAPKFHRVVLESGAPTSRAVRNPDAEIHEAQFKDFLKQVNCPASLPETDVFDYLRSIPTAVIADAQTTVFAKYNASLRWAFQPVIDNATVRGRPIDAWRTGKWHKVPIMTGFQGNEGSLYVDKQMSTSHEFTAFWQTLLPQLSPDDIAHINGLYPDPHTHPASPYAESRTALGVGDMYARIEAAYAHYAYVAPVRQTAFFASQHVPVYVYHWALRRDVIDGAKHGDNMLFEVRDAALCKQAPSLAKLSGMLHAYVTSFVCTGSPDGLRGAYGGRSPWSAYAGPDPRVLMFGGGNSEFIGGERVGELVELVEDEFARRESEFWWSKVEVSQQ
ncbi:acetylcholinesterase precursor [Didymella exigua CBS 183.55]|uniref:Carboxylic ester hydrolase n=1 Tax=Didymella exigua CBS 183.55 TaxID=1150837 RepID=A0A6A5RYT9_9PLEO|nr:acetylcholinesterase precursor [Didymella exigua CBS 183.55]KAF1932520.1 acetylcholinesterase precursor [Didymella exigua CBS 183.55]